MFVSSCSHFFPGRVSREAAEKTTQSKLIFIHHMQINVFITFHKIVFSVYVISDSSVEHVHVLNDICISIIGLLVPAQSLSGTVSTVQKCTKCDRRTKCESGTS